MSGIEKNIKDRLAEHKGLDGIDSQALWDSVTSELDKGTGAGAIRSSRWLIGFLLLLSVSAVGYLTFSDVPMDRLGENSSDRSEVMQEEKALDESNLIQKELATSPVSDDRTSTEKIETVQPEESKSLEQTEELTLSKSENAGSEFLQENHSAPLVQSLSEKASSSAGLEPLSSSNLNETNDPPQSKVVADLSVYGAISEKTDNSNTISSSKRSEARQMSALSPQEGVDQSGLMERTEKDFTELNRLTALMSFVPNIYENNLYQSFARTPELEYRREAKKGWPSEISMWLGANVMQERFGPGSDSNAMGAELQGTTKKDFGTSYAIEASWIFNSGFRLTTGIMVDQFRTRFDRMTQNSTSVELEGQLIGFYPSPSSTPTPIYGTVEQEAIETRTILNHNDYTFISVPISLGFEKVFKRSKVGVDLGAAWTKSLSQQGRSLNGDGTIASFVDGLTPFATDQITYQVSPFFGRMVNDSFEFRIRPTFRSIPRKQSDFYQLEHSAVVYGIQLGLVYNLH